MAIITEPFWWSSFSSFYGFPNDETTTIDSTQVISRLNSYLVPSPSQYSAHLKATQGSSPSTAKLDFSVLTGAHNFISSQAGNDYVSGKAGDDVIYGDAGSDILRGGAGADLIVGSLPGDPTADKDTVSYSDATAGVIAILNNSTTYASADGHGSYDMLIGIENVIGSDFADRIDGQDGVNNTIIGGLGADQLYGGSGNDMLIGGAGADRLYGEAGADIFVAGKDRDSLYLGTGADQDKIIIDTEIMGNIAAHRDNVYDFQVGAGGDKLDVSGLLHAVGYTGSNPVADGYIKLSVMNSVDLKVQFDADGPGSGLAQHLITLSNTNLANFSVSENLVYASRDILYAAILGQSNAKGLSTGGTDSESGATRLKSGLLAMTGYDEVVTVLRDPTSSPIDIAVGGTTVDGNRNTGYTPDQVWWYPDENRPGEVLLRAIDIMAVQIADMRARGTVTPVVVWGQGEAETRLLGRGPDFDGAVARYKNATYAVFDFIKAHLGSDIEFYIMETGRYNDDAARVAGESEQEIQMVQRGLGLLHTAQEDMAIARADIHLAANYSDLRMLHESNPSQFPTDVWHLDYEDREIIGDRLAAFIAADMGLNHVISNPGPYPVRALADLTIHPSDSATAQSIINGTAGDDRLVGVAGGSIINGGAGADKLIATGGENILEGGLGKDSITAASGVDTIVFGSNIASDVTLNADFISKFQAGAGGDRIDISGLLMAVGYTGSDPILDGYLKLVADGTRTKLLFDADGTGGASARYMAMLDGVTTTSFSKTNNLVIYPEDPNPSISGLDIDGSANTDLIIGTLGNDLISGLAGNDMIVAGAGADQLYGGSGSDNFIFDSSVWDESILSSSSSDTLKYADIIEDFTTGAGGDQINIDILLEKAGFNGTDPEANGYITVTQQNSDTLISFDRDGQGASEAVGVALLRGVSAGTFRFEHNLDNSDQSQIV